MRERRNAILFVLMISILQVVTARAETVTATIPLRPTNVVPPVSNLEAEGLMALSIDINRNNAREITSANVNFLLNVRFPGMVTVTGITLSEGSAIAKGSEFLNAGAGSRTFASGAGLIEANKEIDTPSLYRLLVTPTSFYINVMTSANPDGALRGQIATFEESLATTVKMTPEAVVKPPSPLPPSAYATATVSVHVNRHPPSAMVQKAKIEATIAYSFPENVTVTGVKIHRGGIGFNGPVIFDMGVDDAPPVVGPAGKGIINIELDSNLFREVEALIENPISFYIVLETSDHPAGALRAQLRSILKRPLVHLSSTEYVLTAGDAAQTVTLLGTANLRTTGELAAVRINDQSVPFTLGEQPGQISVQVPPAAHLSYSSRLFVQLQNTDGLLSDPIVIAISRSESLNSVAPALVNAANYKSVVAPTSIAALFGTNLASQDARATKLPLPFSLDGTSVYINGRAARLFYAGAQQINLALPTETLSDPSANIVVVNKNGMVSRGTVEVKRTAFGIFTAKGDGTGAPAGVFAPINNTNFMALNNPDGSPATINTGDYVVLFGTGLRHKSAPVEIKIGGVNVTPLFAGDQVVFFALDQINLQIPAELAGKGEVDLEMTVDGIPANPVKLRIR